MIKKLLFLVTLLATSIGTWAQSVTTSHVGDTYTIKGSGDITSISAVDAWKFSDKVNTNPVFTAENESSKVAAQTLCTESITYYVHNGEKYSTVSSVTPLVNKYTLIKTAYKKNENNYINIAANTEVESGDYFSVEATDAEMSGKTETKSVFSSENVESGWYLWSTDQYGNNQKRIIDGSPYNSSDNLKYYVVNSPDNWHWAAEGIQRNEITSSIESYLKEATLVAADANVYTLNDNNYELANGKTYDAGNAYYSLVVADFDETDENNATLKQYINAPTGTYYTLSGEEYISVNQGAIFDAEITYYQLNGYNYREISFNDLKSENYITSANVDYWDFIREDIIASGCNKVVFENVGSDLLTINPTIVQKLVSKEGIVSADFGAATTTTYESLLGSTLATSLNYITFPLTQMTGEDMIFPAGVYNNFQWREQAMNVTIPNGFTKVADNAFKIPSDNRSYGIKALVSVVLPTTLVEIGNCAFMSAANLTSVTYIGYTGDKDIAFPSTLRKIGIEAFSGDDKLVNFDLNSGLEFIGNSAFYLNHTVGGQAPILDFPASLKYLGPGSFLNRDYAEIYFHGEIAPICPVGPYYDNSVFYNQDATAFTAATHMGNNGFTTDATKIGGDNANIGYANRENYQNNGTYFTVLHFPAGISIENAKTYKDVTRRYETVEDLSTFVYNASYIPCGEEPEDNVRSFQDHGAQASWAAAGDFHITTAGHIDTYLGRQKIWPSQPQWMRAYCTVANGVEWNGVNQYRPTITSDMLALMAEDGLKLWDGTKYVAVGSNEYTFTTETADAYNLAHFPDYWNENTINEPAVLYTNDEVDNYNFENVEGAIQEGQTLYYTQKEIDDHNANFDGARHAGYVEKGRPAGYMTWEEYILTPTMVAMAPNYKNSWGGDLDENSYNEKIAGMKANTSAGPEAFGLPVDPRTPATPDYTYTEEDARDYNYAHCSEYGIEPWTAPKEKGIATRETAAAYNLTLPGAWQYGRVMTPATHYTAEQIAAHNATITGLVHEGEPASVNDAMADYISKIAYQATRRFVLADDGSYIPSEDDEYEIPMLGHNWWTICLPFSMTKAEVDDVFGEGTHVCLFSGVDRDAKSATKHITLKFQNDVYVHKTAVAETAVEGKGILRTYSENFNPDAAAPGDDDIVIQAFEAYMIYPQKDGKDAATFYVPNPRVEQGAPYPTIVEANKAVNGNVPAYVNSEDHTEYRFVGNLLESLVQENDNGEQVLVTNKIPQYSYMYAQKKGDANYKFWFNKSATITWPVKKCVVQATAKDGGAADSNNFFGENNIQAKQTSIFGDFYDEYNSDNDTTEIENVTIIAGEGKDSQVIYNLNGQQIYSAPNKGVYIKNGKKHITR